MHEAILNWVLTPELFMLDKADKAQQLKDRLAFVDFGDAERDALFSALPIIRGALDVALDNFYAKAGSHPETAKFFSGKAHVASAKARQINHWEVIATARFDGAYVDAVTKVGETHARLGLSPRWYIGGYALILEKLIAGVIERELQGFLTGGKAKALKSSIGAVVKAALVDMDYAITVYLDALERQRQAAEQEREVLKAEQDRALAELDVALGHLAEGNLTVPIQRELAANFARLKSNFNGSIASLSSAMGEISEAVQEVTSETGEISSATDEMSRRGEHQAAALEESAAALEEISTLSKITATRAYEIQEIIKSSAEQAKLSGQVVHDTISAMRDIVESSEQIGQTIGVIDDIAFQTNLLALNAGVEAARAGEAGKGFAVVAQEVRELAQRSATAAKEIKALVARSSHDVAKGVTLVEKTGSVLTEIGGKIGTIREHIDQIAQSVSEQSSGIHEINTAVGHMDQITQQNAAMMEETNASIQNLKALSNGLQELIMRFKVTDRASNLANLRRTG